MNAPATFDAVTRDAARLVVVAAPGDWPGGFVVIHERLPARVQGLAVGDGLQLARLYGQRHGPAAVLVDAGKCLAGNVPTENELAALDAVVLHEAAHVLTASPTPPDTVEAALDNAPETVPAYDAGKIARQHCPRWAAAFWILTTRAADYRPRRGDCIRNAVARQLAAYGFEAARVAAAAAGVNNATSLRELLAPDGAAAVVLAAVLPDHDTRAVAIGGAGIVGAGSNAKGET